ncbi:MAG: endonuclease/exonuclease/phosphatase family protein [Nocardioides sp.]
MRRWLLAALVVVLTGCADSAPPADDPAPSPTATVPPSQSSEPGSTLEPCPRGDSSRLTALTLNIHGGRTKAGVLDLERVAAELRGWDADVVLLQEVDRGRERSDTEAQAEWLGDALGLEWAYGPTRRLRSGSSGNAVLSRFPVVDSRFRSLPRLPGLYRRGLVQVTVDVEGREVDVLSTHLDHVAPAARRAQAAAIAAVVRGSERPALLGGDLNAEPGLPPLAILDRAGLVDPWPLVGNGSGLTVPAADPQRRIDYVLADDSFAPLRSEVLISSISDHRAVRTSLELLPPDC